MSKLVELFEKTLNSMNTIDYNIVYTMQREFGLRMEEINEMAVATARAMNQSIIDTLTKGKK